MKQFTEQQVDDIIKLKFGALVQTADHCSFVSNKILGKIFGVSGSKIRQLYLDRFEAIRVKKLSLLEQMQQSQRR